MLFLKTEGAGLASSAKGKKTGAKKTPEEAKDMIELAVNVVHAFATLLPDAGENVALVARAPGLIRVLPEWWVMFLFLVKEKCNEDFSVAARPSQQPRYFRRCWHSRQGGRVRRLCWVFRI